MRNQSAILVGAHGLQKRCVGCSDSVGCGCQINCNQFCAPHHKRSTAESVVHIVASIQGVYESI